MTVPFKAVGLFVRLGIKHRLREVVTERPPRRLTRRRTQRFEQTQRPGIGRRWRQGMFDSRKLFTTNSADRGRFSGFVVSRRLTSLSSVGWLDNVGLISLGNGPAST